MALRIPIPDSAWSEQDVSLGGINYTFTFSYNSRDSRWRFDLTINEVVVISGIKVVENQFFLERYALSGFDHGDIACIRSEEDGKDVGRDNFGIDKSYELVYFTNEELVAL
jgi:hypothetical protein